MELVQGQRLTPYNGPNRTAFITFVLRLMAEAEAAPKMFPWKEVEKMEE
jgi:hypothetical protein